MVGGVRGFAVWVLASSKKQEARSKKQEKQEARSKKQEKQEARSKKQEARSKKVWV